MIARWDAAELLQPISAEQPCGEDLDSTQLLASFDSFRLFGQSTPFKAVPEPGDAPVPEWLDIKRKANEALARSKDLRVLAHLGTALLRTDGLPAFTGTLQVAAGWLETYWVQVYPLIDEDAFLRRNALNCFADPMAVLDGLRRAPLVSNRHGSFTLRDIDLSTGQMPVGEKDVRPDEVQINAAFADMPLADLSLLQESVSGGLDALKRIDAKMAAEAGPEDSSGFAPLSAQLLKMERVLRTQLAARADATGVVGDAEGGDAAEGGVVTGRAIGAIASRKDAIRALDAVADYFRRTEPSSPIPMFVERAKRLVSKDFLEVLADIAPDALAQARSAGGLPPGE